jgi:ectoine hydroxylase-related dioxygenase (phytanoyl-CoA dioxygenase family)
MTGERREIHDSFNRVTNGTVGMISEQISREGYCLVPNVIGPERIDALIASLSTIDGANVRRRGEMYAIRNLFEASPSVRALAQSSEIRTLAQAVLGAHCFAVQAVLLDKIPDANWKVPFHQDLYVPLAVRVEMPGWSGWSEKAGVVHAKAPAKVLESMLSVRVHLDDCDEASGTLRVIPGSHRSGELNGPEIKQWEERFKQAACIAPRGSVLLIRPLLLHASSPATNPGHRRVIQLQFANQELPGGLAWHARL